LIAARAFSSAEQSRRSLSFQPSASPSSSALWGLRHSSTASAATEYLLSSAMADVVSSRIWESSATAALDALRRPALVAGLQK
jgi:hypothetical protein